MSVCVVAALVGYSSMDTGTQQPHGAATGWCRVNGGVCLCDAVCCAGDCAVMQCFACQCLCEQQCSQPLRKVRRCWTMQQAVAPHPVHTAVQQCASVC
jgi:hypothetical protein